MKNAKNKKMLKKGANNLAVPDFDEDVDATARHEIEIPYLEPPDPESFLIVSSIMDNLVFKTG